MLLEDRIRALRTHKETIINGKSLQLEYQEETINNYTKEKRRIMPVAIKQMHISEDNY